ncbi:MAG: DUF169 domain-containing protein [Deltaproteobacteria bacterium]|jgi:hypothetical protein|nr:DUF169 domain-containing protein [Deltaproteobacteria bacterium]
MKKTPSRHFRLREALGLQHPVIGLWYEDRVPENAATGREAQSKTALWGCSMFLVNLAFGGNAVAFTPEFSQCPGAAIGLGLPPNPNESFPGGRGALYRYMSVGNRCCQEGREAARRLRADGVQESRVQEFLEGEGLKKSSEIVEEYYAGAPLEPPEGEVLVMRPLAPEDIERPPKVALMIADAIQLSALVVLANYESTGLDGVRIPMASACASIAAIPLREAREENPRAVVGLTDVSARRVMQRVLSRNRVSVAVPWKLYARMEENADSSFLSRAYWRRMIG